MSPGRSSPRRVVILGQGYVGWPFAMRVAEVGFDVVGFDVDPDRVALLARGESFIEDVPDNELRRHLDSRRYRLSADVAGLDGFDVAVISVPTPSREGLPDIAYIEQASVFKTVVLVALVRACNDGIVDPAGRVTIESRCRLG